VPDLAPAGAISSGEGSHARGIAPGGGLGKAEAPHSLAAGHLGEPFLLLLLASELVDRGHRERPLHGDEGPQARIASLKLHARQAVGDRALSGAPVAGEVGVDIQKVARRGGLRTRRQPASRS
jgi:hypothetical protein